MSVRPTTRRPELVSIREASIYCGVDPRTIRRWIAAGRLNAVRVGPRLIKIDTAELDRIVCPVGGGAA